MRNALIVVLLICASIGLVQSIRSEGVRNDSVSAVSNGIELKEESEVSEELSILFFGDMMLDRIVRQRVEREGAERLFEPLRETLSDTDAVVANLEGVFTSYESISLQDFNTLRFTFDPALAPVLKRYYISHLSTANNHSNDFGREGAEESRRILDGAGIESFGNYFNSEAQVSRIPFGKHFVSLVAYNEFSRRGLSETLDVIQKEHEAGNIVIVMPHWGIEYETVHASSQEILAQSFIDAGATAVIGAHPHVVQDVGVYKGKLIFYSLGNFIFDQEFSKETQEGLGVKINLKGDTVSYELLPLDIIRSAPMLKLEEDKGIFLQSLADRSDEVLRDQIREGRIDTGQN